ncbi:sigma-70 family RNA polymerase sigma factor [Neptunomonas qingdaonensis]|uniref:RNA polymerase sigma-70 factor, ECF subfamily n=1 Tax=Neptunomonas qingdaonensis TaxID=1045558 RepID=A0A1I2PUX5_9GAMM|nr:sigma-70 family RNA polymerase sigma factor [Neptunomonas qingdaonensis]SFG20065.1 RNA polymerase sigma-70 factor, ECF subfamily [Neptunomonas qingdaonensis]
MENKPPGDDMDNVAVMQQPEGPQVWNSMLSDLAETKDKALYVKLFRHFAPKVKAYIIRLGLVETTAEELMQETMLSVWRKAHLYNASKAAASTWIFTLARNQSIDRMRKQKYPEYSLEAWQEGGHEEQHEGPGEEQDVCEQAVTSDRMAKVISQLPEDQAQVIYMSFYEGRSHSDISERLGVPLGSVKSRIRLASEKIKMMWRDDV